MFSTIFGVFTMTMFEAYLDETGADPETTTYEDAYEYYEGIHNDRAEEEAKDRRLDV